MEERCKHGMLLNTCGICINWKSSMKKNLQKMINQEKMLIFEKRKRDSKEKVYRRLHTYVMQCHGTFADMIGEYSIQEAGDIESFTSGAWAPTVNQIEECMRESIYCHYGHFDEVLRNEIFVFWKRDKMLNWS